MARPSPESSPLRTITRYNDDLWTGQTVTQPWDPACSAKYRSYTGGVTPGYKDFTRRKRVKLTTLNHTVFGYQAGGTPMLADKVLYKSGSTWGGSAIRYSNSLCAGLATFPSISHLVEADTKARARLADAMGGLKVNLAQAFAERKQTASLVAVSAERIVMALRALKRGDLRGFQASLSTTRNFGVSTSQWERTLRTPPSKRVSNHWLEYKYGWKPLLQDVYGAVDLLSEHIANDAYHDAKKGSASFTQNARVKDASFPFEERLTSKTSRSEIAVRFKMDNDCIAALSTTGVTNPALLAWELLPYSFVIDWFLPVGNYLQALNAFCGFTFLDGYTAKRTRQKHMATVNATRVRSDLPGPGIQSKSWQYWREEYLYERQRLSTFPGVSFPSFKDPLWSDKASSQTEKFADRVFTSLALMRVLFK